MRPLGTMSLLYMITMGLLYAAAVRGVHVQDPLALKALAAKLASPSLMASLPLAHQGPFDPSQIQLEPLSDALASDCYRCRYGAYLPVFFVKHAPLSEEQKFKLKLDFHGLTSFAKYTPDLVPRVFFFDEEGGLMVCEFSDDFRPVGELFAQGRAPLELAQSGATLMGRNHAKTHRLLLPPEQGERLRALFHNEAHLRGWSAAHLLPCLSLLRSLPFQEREAGCPPLMEAGPSFFEAYCAREVSPEHFGRAPVQLLALLGDASLLSVFEDLKLKFLGEKQTLIHGALSPLSLLFDASLLEQEDALRLRVVHFEGCCYGCAGADLGLFLSLYAYYYLAHSAPLSRRSLRAQFFSALEAYRAAFRLQMEGERRRRASRPGGFQSLNVEEALGGVLLDCAGFLGLSLFLSFVKGEGGERVGVEWRRVWEREGGGSYRALPEYQRYDREGRERALGRRGLLFSLQCLQIYSRHRERERRGEGVEAKEVLEEVQGVFARDDQLLLSEHPSEFWY